MQVNQEIFKRFAKDNGKTFSEACELWGKMARVPYSKRIEILKKNFKEEEIEKLAEAMVASK